MKKVGIITLFTLTNYGNRLQVYALSKALEKLDCKPCEIHYRKKGLKAFIKENIRTNYFFYCCLEFFRGIFRRQNISLLMKQNKRIRLCSAFSKKVKGKIISSDTPSIDCYVCGSDQIWNPRFAGKAMYFAEFAHNEKRISYAASFGVSSINEKASVRYKSYLSGIKNISVREKQGAELVKELTGREAEVVIDPTLLLDKNDWNKASKKPKYDVEEKFLLTYFLGEVSDEIKNYVKKISTENNLKVISLEKMKRNDYWYNTGPAEFIWLIENASLICTDSFHASVFSIIMESPFIVFKRIYKNNDMSSRFISLLGMFKLTSRFYENIKAGDEFKKEYSHIAEILEAERKKACVFLKEALNLTEEKTEND